MKVTVDHQYIEQLKWELGCCEEERDELAERVAALEAALQQLSDWFTAYGDGTESEEPCWIIANALKGGDA